MRIKQLHLENIGPFIEADLDFIPHENGKPPVTLITGENGTGKTIILDAIRGMFGSPYASLTRNIKRATSNENSSITISLLNLWEGKEILNSTSIKVGDQIQSNIHLHNRERNEDGQFSPNWIMDFWTSTIAEGSYKIDTWTHPNYKNFLWHALNGKRQKEDISQFILYADYLRDSSDAQEKALGQKLYDFIAKIVEESLLEGGKFSHVSRLRFEPIVIQNGLEVNLSQLSSGNSYLIQNLMSLLTKMLAVYVLRKIPLAELGQTPGLLLIDEAENQLHPKWQKRLIPTILELFPNLQIIATTHSPFIISSVKDARLFVCKAEGDHCVVVDESENYSNKPVEEILMSPLFEGTRPFSSEITKLLEEREDAILKDDQPKRDKIEAKLKELNPEYFSYFDVDKLIAEIAAQG